MYTQEKFYKRARSDDGVKAKVYTVAFRQAAFVSVDVVKENGGTLRMQFSAEEAKIFAEALLRSHDLVMKSLGK